MNISRWHMNRMGLVDFWCYENEVFEFENGHMLLRGSNGSGKSVTMQSFIPLLLDGNKNSERLDAFGTRSRKMDTYLIDENSDREERIGYLYLEFKREDSDIFKTIGMGLRARKNKPLQAWYFVIEDGRRINIDFSLIENRLTLSEKQLKNILGEQVISTQSEYMKRVNDALFGFETLDDYADAISLLIQLRSPKLSNSLNPQKINEILGKSLQPLSDEELRPMSEAIVNMDNLQDQLESLKQSLKAAKTIEQAYQTYNKAVLLNKWSKYAKELQKQHQLQQEIALKNNEKTTYIERINQAKSKSQEYRIEREVKESELLNLKNQNIEQWVGMIAQLEKELIDWQAQKEKKEQIHESKEQQLIDSKSNLQKYVDQQATYQERCEDVLNEMEELNQNLYLSEQLALQECFDKRDENFAFSYTYQQIKEKIKEIELGLSAWQQYEEQLNKLDFHQMQKNEVDLAIEKVQHDIQEAERNYRQMVEEYLELYHQYNETNRFLKLSAEEMEKLRKGLIDYEKTKDYTVIKKVVDQQFYKLSDGYRHEKAELDMSIRMFQDELRTLKKEYDNWDKMSDPEPERAVEMMDNRTYLNQEKIDYIPLYKLLDFDVDMSEEAKNQIEELLMQMHLLDALIIERKHQGIVQKAPMGCLDYYLWSNKELDKLQTVTIKTPFDKSQFIDILTQLGIVAEKDIRIEDRYFQSGVIEGSLSLSKPAVYIGYERRLKLKQEKLEELRLQIAKCEEKLQSTQERYQHCQAAIEILNKELSDFIDERRLKESLNQVGDFTAEYHRLMQQLEQLNIKMKEFEEKKNQIYAQLQVYASKLMLSLQKASFEERKADLLEYQEYLHTFKDYYNNLLTMSKFKEIESDKVEQLNLDVDELRYEISQLEQKERVTLQKIDSFKKQLEEAGYSEITQKISNIQHRLDELSDLIQRLNDDVIRFETEVEHLKGEVAQKEEALILQQEQVKIYQDILHQEVDYHFLLPAGLDERSLVKELRNLSAMNELKKSVDEYKNQLQEVYFKQYTYLTQYNVVQENVELCHNVEDINKRIMLKAMDRGKKVGFLELIDGLNQNIEAQEMLIADEDRHIFEEILVNTIGKKIRERIQTSHRWVEKMQSYMDDMNTSSGLQLSLKWRSRKAVDDSELDSSQLVELLEKDYRILKESDRQKISTHFRSKISRARKLSLDENTSASFHQLMKEVMDYRQWFDFTLYAKKPNEQRKELTSHVFFAYSGGEKALSMYVPLFSAVAAKFESAREDAPRVIALDEAFAGVDENNIDNMFALITKFGFDYIMNSQVLWGDYPSCRSLAIYELFRPNNAPFVSVVSYLWNGHQKRVRYS